MPDAVIELFQLGMPWIGHDPFIFTVHHVDNYPPGDDDLGPSVPLYGRQIGSDFSYIDGWSMYHGERVPGFPQHPHRGFETVTVVRRGYVDHSDSLGATARYGEGDVQWLTTGGGIQHAEMFPLLDSEGPNPLELYQIWLNLPPDSKMVPAYFGMLWSEDIPTVVPARGVLVDVVTGALDDQKPPSPPPDSWAARPDSDMAIWVIELEPGAEWEIPAAPAGLNRSLHCHGGTDIEIGGTKIGKGVGVRLRSEAPVTLANRGDEVARFLLLQGRPIGAPVFQMGPFVMNSPEELRQAVDDYRRTQFGPWPWGGPAHTHPRDEGRFAMHVDGRVERREIV